MNEILNRLPLVKAGEWKKRRADAQAHRDTWNAGAPARAAISLIQGHAAERRARADYLAGCEAERDVVKADIAAARARVLSLKADDLPAAEARVLAARLRLEALTGDVERAQRLLDAEALVAGDGAK